MMRLVLTCAVLAMLLAPLPALAMKNGVSVNHATGIIMVGDGLVGCSATTKGGIRYNSTSNYPQFCDGTTWTALATVQATSPPTAPSGSGYLVMSYGTYDGNLGGLAGANAVCLTDITTHTGWSGYADSNSRSLLNSSHVGAFLGSGDGGTANNLMPSTTYYFSNANNSSYGGASVTTDASAQGPTGDTVSWAAANRFGGAYFWWSHRQDVGCSTNQWGIYGGGACGHNGNDCVGWAANGSGNNGTVGNTSATDSGRWDDNGGTYTCNTLKNLICYVNP